MNEFYALDIETANEDVSSICQIGIAHFVDGCLVDTFCSYVDPEEEFSYINIDIHGITREMVSGSPKVDEVLESIRPTLENKIVAHHMPFDKASLSKAALRYGKEMINCDWVDTARVVRRVWEEYRQVGYGLSNISNHLGISFTHHDALEDARAAGLVLINALNKSGMSLDEMIKHAGSRCPRDFSKLKMNGNPDGELAGERIVFTGTLGIPREIASSLAAESGCDVQPKVNMATTILVVGDQDSWKLVGKEKSSKHLYAEELIGKGVPIRILAETDFYLLIGDKEHLRVKEKQIKKTEQTNLTLFKGKEFVIDGYRLSRDVWKFIKENGGVFENDVKRSTFALLTDNVKGKTPKTIKALQYIDKGCNLVLVGPKQFKSIPVLLDSLSMFSTGEKSQPTV